MSDIAENPVTPWEALASSPRRVEYVSDGPVTIRLVEPESIGQVDGAAVDATKAKKIAEATSARLGFDFKTTDIQAAHWIMAVADPAPSLDQVLALLISKRVGLFVKLRYKAQLVCGVVDDTVIDDAEGN